jgi:hypothetical protein
VLARAAAILLVSRHIL